MDCPDTLNNEEDLNSADVATSSASAENNSDLSNALSLTSSVIRGDIKYIYPSHMKILEAKLALNSGKEHVTLKGKVRQARQVRLPCREMCKRCQNPRISHEERLQVNEEFWKLENHLEQWRFITKSIEISAPKKKFVASGVKREKLSIRSYFFIINGQERKVCKTMFKNTLCICDSWVDNAISHCSGPSVREDLRGRHTNRPKRGLKQQPSL